MRGSPGGSQTAGVEDVTRTRSPQRHEARASAPTTATIVVSDLVDSTRQRVDLGEELADRLGHLHDELVERAVNHRNGMLVKGTGDGALAAFGSASEGLAAAVELRELFRSYSESSEAIAPLTARFGIAAGDVTWSQVGGRPDCFGLAVIEAARLEGQAGADEILCSDLVQMLACGRGSHVYESLGPIQLDGFPTPKLVSRVTSAAPRQSVGHTTFHGAERAIPQRSLAIAASQ